MNRSTLEGYRGPYLKRNGEDARVITEKLLQPPERPLSSAGLHEVRDFESGFLYDYEIEPGVTIANVIRNHKSDDLVAPQIFAEAFVRNAIDMSGLPGGVEVPEFTNHTEVYQWFARRVEDGSVDQDTLRTLAKDSVGFYKKAVEHALVAGENTPTELADAQQVVLDPEHAIELARNTLIARQHVLELRGLYSENTDDNLDGAKRALIDVYLAKINAQIASDIPAMNYLVHQADLVGNPELARAAVSVMPAGFQHGLEVNGLQNSELDRLDYIRNGMGLDEQEVATPISSKLFESRDETSEQGMSEAFFTPEQVEVLKRTMIEPDDMEKIFTAILRKHSLLSAEDASTWEAGKRRHRAADGLFQVVKNPSKDSFAVDGTSGVYKYSAKERSLYDVLFVGGVHELVHINQAQADVDMSDQVKIAGLKGKRVSVLKEGGANSKQREAEKKLTGHSKPVALTYTKALQVLRGGGSLMEAARAFYDEKRAIMPETSPQEAAKEAADRVLRLLRNGGSSGVLSYGEEGIMINELAGSSDEVQVRAGATTSFDLVDQLRLHRYGLITINNDAAIDWTPTVLEELAPYIDDAFAKAGI